MNIGTDISAISQDWPGVSKDVLLRKLYAEGASLVQEDDVSIELVKDGDPFFIPQPLAGGFYYSKMQLEFLDILLARRDIDLLPFDYNLH